MTCSSSALSLPLSLSLSLSLSLYSCVVELRMPHPPAPLHQLQTDTMALCGSLRGRLAGGHRGARPGASGGGAEELGVHEPHPQAGDRSSAWMKKIRWSSPGDPRAAAQGGELYTAGGGRPSFSSLARYCLATSYRTGDVHKILAFVAERF